MRQKERRLKEENLPAPCFFFWRGSLKFKFTQKVSNCRENVGTQAKVTHGTSAEDSGNSGPIKASTHFSPSLAEEPFKNAVTWKWFISCTSSVLRKMNCRTGWRGTESIKRTGGWDNCRSTDARWPSSSVYRKVNCLHHAKGLWWDLWGGVNLKAASVWKY